MSTVENNDSKFRCNICDKSYKDKSGIWYHNKKYHNIFSHSNTLNTAKTSPETAKPSPETAKTSPETAKPSPETAKTSPETAKTSPETAKTSPETAKEINCEYCNYNFTRRDSLIKHYNRCKIKKENDNKIINKNDENNILKLIIEKQSAEIKEVKLMISSLINKNCKVHPKTLQKINKQLINDNKNINNGTINNNITYNIIGLGHENLTDVFSKKEKMAILKNRFYCLPGSKEPRGF